MQNREKRKKREEEKSFGRRKKASLTVECAFILPLFLLTITVLVSLMYLYRISGSIQSALCEGARELSMYAYGIQKKEENDLGKGICMAYGTQKIRKVLEGESLLGIQGGISGISLLGTEVQKNLITLKADFYYKSPVAFLGSFPVKLQICGASRAWVGGQGENYGEDTKEELVYLSDWESVYHTSETCSHLSLEIQKVSFREAEQKRNQYGEKYEICGKCGKGTRAGNVYITSFGDKIHMDPGCAGLTRYVKTVRKSETDGLRPCTRCGG